MWRGFGWFSEPMLASANRATRRTKDEQYGTHHQQDDTDGGHDADAGQHADDNQNDTDDDHALSNPMLTQPAVDQASETPRCGLTIGDRCWHPRRTIATSVPDQDSLVEPR